MTDDSLRNLERAYLADPSDEDALDRYLDELRRRELDPVEHLAATGGAAPWAVLLRASVPIHKTQPNGEAFGRRIPVFVWNGSHFFTHADVYADGVIDAWGGVDRALFERKLSDSPGSDGPPVVTTAPVGANVSIHNLGGARVAEGSWLATRADVGKAADMVLRALRTPGAPLLDLRGDSVEVRDGVRYAKLSLSNGRPYRRLADGRTLRGASCPVLERTSPGEVRLTTWNVFEDGESQLGGGGPLVPFAAIAARIEKGDVTTQPADGERILVPGLGSFLPGEASWYIEPIDRVREATDTLAVLRGEPGVHVRCREVFAEYEREEARAPRTEGAAEPPSLTAARERLRAAYEAVPSHLRIYLGDMDSRDRPIRRALGALEEWEVADEL